MIDSDSETRDTHDQPSSEKKRRYSLEELHNFTVPWNSFDSNTIKMLDEKNWNSLDQKMKDKIIKRSVHILVECVRKHTDHTPIKVFLSAAKQMSEKYGHAFGDKLPSGKIHGT